MIKRRRSIFIVTANDFLIYQPTILALYDFLSIDYDVTIVSFEPRFISREKDETRQVKYLKIPDSVVFAIQNIDSLIFKGLKFLSRFRDVRMPVYTRYHKLQFSYLKTFLKKNRADKIIAVDIPALYITQQVYGRSDFLSLELAENDPSPFDHLSTINFAKSWNKTFGFHPKLRIVEGSDTNLLYSALKPDNIST